MNQSHIPEDERWIWENPEIIGEILQATKEMERGIMVRRKRPAPGAR